MLLRRIFSRQLLFSLVLVSVAGSVTSYFVRHAVHGQRGLKTGEEYEQKLTQLKFERDMLKMQRLQFERRLALIKGEKVDADILEDEVRKTLGRVHKNEVVVLMTPLDRQ
jgi:cell division protein FtsB